MKVKELISVTLIAIIFAFIFVCQSCTIKKASNTYNDTINISDNHTYGFVDSSIVLIEYTQSMYINAFAPVGDSMIYVMANTTAMLNDVIELGKNKIRTYETKQKIDSLIFIVWENTHKLNIAIDNNKKL